MSFIRVLVTEHIAVVLVLVACRRHQLPTSSLPMDAPGARENEECIIGLETRTPRENLICHQAIRQAIFAVLDEQDDQLRFEGRLNEDILAARYMSYTMSCKDRALWLGQAAAA